MRKTIILFTALALLVSLSLPALAYDQTGRLGLGYRFGGHTVMKDPWKLKFMHGGEVKFCFHPNWAVAVTGTYGRTNGGILDMTGALPKFVEPAGDAKSFSLRNYMVEVGPVYNLMPYDQTNVYLAAGVGIGGWTVKDVDGKQLQVPDKNGNLFDLSDQQVTVMLGAGVEYFLIENFSIGASARYHIFTNALSKFKDDKDIGGSDGLDLPGGLLEGGATVIAYFGKCKDDDKDGVCNDVDKCPDTPDGCLVDEFGCPIDTDGDGVCDGRDKCPDTPKCAKVDLNGCPMDTDKDGVYDRDKCPNTPAGCKVDADGCEFDADKDKVPDCLDKCPDTPTCCKVNADGCPLDSDNDGVCDGCDECPGTPAGLKVKPNGCSEAGFERWELPSVTFVVNTWELTDASKNVLNPVVDTLMKYADVRVEVQGHTDPSGRPGWNDTLSTNRAAAVVDHFVSKGLDRARFTSKGFGSSMPKYDNATADGRRKNRRVELLRVN